MAETDQEPQDDLGIYEITISSRWSAYNDVYTEIFEKEHPDYKKEKDEERNATAKQYNKEKEEKKPFYQETKMQPGREIGATGIIDYQGDDEPEGIAKNDGRLPQLIKFSKQVRLAIDKGDINLLPKSTNDDEKKATQENAEAIENAKIAMDKNSSLAAQEQAKAKILHNELINVVDPYDPKVAQSIKDAYQEIKKLDQTVPSPEELRNLVHENSWTGHQTNKVVSKIQDAYKSIEYKYNLIERGLASKDELEGKTISYQDYRNYKRQAESCNEKLVNNAGVEHFEDFGKGSQDHLDRGFICRHYAPYMAAMLDAAGVKTYVIGTIGHVTTVSRATGNQIDPTADHKNIYQINVGGSNLRELSEGQAGIFLRPDGNPTIIISEEYMSKLQKDKEPNANVAYKFLEQMSDEARKAYYEFCLKHGQNHCDGQKPINDGYAKKPTELSPSNSGSLDR